MLALHATSSGDEVARGPCGDCEKDPAEGFASITTDGVTTWYCHGDEDPTCYMLALRGWDKIPRRYLHPLSLGDSDATEQAANSGADEAEQEGTQAHP